MAVSKMLFEILIALSINFYFTCLPTVKTFKVEPLELIHERIEVVACEKPYLTNCTCSVGRISRHSPSIMNVSGMILVPYTNNVTIRFAILEPRGNAFERGVVEYESKLCDMLENTKSWFWVPQLQNASNFPRKCPVTNNVTVTNFAYDFMNFPSIFPFRRFVWQLICLITKTRTIFYQVNVHMRTVKIKGNDKPMNNRNVTKSAKNN